MFSLRSTTRPVSSLLLRATPSSVRSFAAPPPSHDIASSSSPTNVAGQASPASNAAAEKQARYPHTRPAPRMAPVVPVGATPIPGHGPWSMVQTGAHGRIPPPVDTSHPEGKPGVIGEGLFYGTEADLLRWELTNSGAAVVIGVAGVVLIVGTGYVMWVGAGGNKPLWGAPPKPAGDYSLEEDKARDAKARRREAEIAAREKAAQLKTQAASEISSLSGRLDSAKDEIAGKVEDAAGKIANNASAQLQYLGEKYQDLKTKA